MGRSFRKVIGQLKGVLHSNQWALAHLTCKILIIRSKDQWHPLAEIVSEPPYFVVLSSIDGLDFVE